MKSKAILFGLVVALLGIFAISQSHAQTVDASGISVLPANRGDMIKVIYANEASETVEIRFLDADGLIKSDKINPESFEKGFSKKYKVKRLASDGFWIEVKNPELSVLYKVDNKDGKWLAQLEKTVSQRALASR